MLLFIKKTLLLLSACMVLFVGVSGNAFARSLDDDIHRYDSVLSEFIYSMFLFVRWPEGTFNASDSPIRIVFFGGHELADKAHEIIGERKVGNRHVVVEKARYLEDIVSCHAIFIGLDKAEELDSVLNAFSAKPIVTMGDSQGFSEKGVIFNFFTDKAKIRFKSNIGAAEKAGIRISSELLKLSLIIGDEAHVR